MAFANCDRLRQPVFNLSGADVRAAEDRARDDPAVSAENAAGAFLIRHAGHQLDAGVGRVVGQCGDANCIGWRRVVVVVEIAIGRGPATAWASVRLDRRAHGRVVRVGRRPLALESQLL